MAAGSLALEPLVGAALALRQKAGVQLTGEEDEARIRLGRLGDEVLGQLRVPLDRDQAAGLDAAPHLLEEGQRHIGELARCSQACVAAFRFSWRQSVGLPTP